MDDLKVVMTFINKYFRDFLKIFIINFTIFIILLSSELFLFFYLSKNNHPVSILFLILFVLFLFYFLIKRKILSKYLWDFACNFYRFLKKDDYRLNSAKDKFEYKKYIYNVRKCLKSIGLKLIPFSVKIALSSSGVSCEGDINKFKSDVSRLLLKFRKVFFYNFITSLIIAIPFVLISIVFTIGFSIKVKILVISTGFIFFLFIKSSIIDVVTILLVKKIHFDLSK